MNLFFLKSVLIAPIVVQERTLGFILIEIKRNISLDYDELIVLMLVSNQMGISIENARLYEKMEKLTRMDEFDENL